MSTLLSIDRLGGGYGPLAIFSDATMDVAAGQTIGILGPNGAGKTTFLKTVVGLLPSAHGAVRLDGRDLTQLAAFQRVRLGLALVPEGRQILRDLSVGENLELSLAGSALDLPTYRERRERVFTLFPRLKERASQQGGSLSGGEQQMLAIGRALMLAPKVLMLDEPTQGLAPIVIQQVASTLHSLKGQFSMIVVEQNRVFVEGLADRIFMMQSGRLIAV
ncbi:MAG: ABC transporter ATP-binding protein [Burkholderiales bacterium]